MFTSGEHEAPVEQHQHREDEEARPTPRAMMKLTISSLLPAWSLPDAPRWRRRAGRFFIVGRAWIFFMTAPLTAPLREIGADDDAALLVDSAGSRTARRRS